MYSSDSPVNVCPVFDTTNNRIVISYRDTSATNDGKGRLIDPISTNAANYIGISNGAYSSGATATVQVVGSIDDAQSGLQAATTYFVADDGSLTTTNNGRKIGTAVSSNELLIDTAMSGPEMNAYLGGLV